MQWCYPNKRSAPALGRMYTVVQKIMNVFIFACFWQLYIGQHCLICYGLLQIGTFWDYTNVKAITSASPKQLGTLFAIIILTFSI